MCTRLKRVCVPKGTLTFVEDGNQGKSAGCGLTTQSRLGGLAGCRSRRELERAPPPFGLCPGLIREVESSPLTLTNP